MTTQRDKILEHLEDNKTLTSMEAFEKFGATRLAAQIHDLRKKGYDIETRMCAGKNRYGGHCEYAKYVFHGKKGE